MSSAFIISQGYTQTRTHTHFNTRLCCSIVYIVYFVFCILYTVFSYSSRVKVELELDLKLGLGLDVKAEALLFGCSRQFEGHGRIRLNPCQVHLLASSVFVHFFGPRKTNADDHGYCTTIECGIKFDRSRVVRLRVRAYLASLKLDHRWYTCHKALERLNSLAS